MGKQQFDDAPLFDVPPPVDNAERQQGQRSVAFGSCPGHARSEKLTGLIRQGEHLYWRDHYVPTWAGTSRPCAAAHQALHDKPSRSGEPICPCQRPTGGADR